MKLRNVFPSKLAHVDHTLIELIYVNCCLLLMTWPDLFGLLSLWTRWGRDPTDAASWEVEAAAVGARNM